MTEAPLDLPDVRCLSTEGLHHIRAELATMDLRATRVWEQVEAELPALQPVIDQLANAPLDTIDAGLVVPLLPRIAALAQLAISQRMLRAGFTQIDAELQRRG